MVVASGSRASPPRAPSSASACRASAPSPAPCDRSRTLVMQRFAFVLHRPLQLVPVLIGISIVTFVLVHAIPGDPVRALLGTRGTAETVAAIRAQYGLDQPVAVQYGYFIKNLLEGELGRSVIYKAPVLAVVVGRT